MPSLNSYHSISMLPLPCQFWGKAIPFNGNYLHFQGGLSLKPQWEQLHFTGSALTKRRSAVFC